MRLASEWWRPVAASREAGIRKSGIWMNGHMLMQIPGYLVATRNVFCGSAYH